MGIDPLTMFFIQTGLSLVGGLMEAGAAGRDREAAGQQHDAEIAELTRQQGEEARIAGQRRDRRSIQADEEAASMTVAMAESGGAGTLNALALAGEIGYMEGLDLAAINATAASKIASLQAQKTMSGMRMQATQRRAQTRAGRATINFFGGVAGAAGDYTSAKRKAAKSAIPQSTLS